MRDTSIKVLLIEDDEEDYMITRDILADIPGRKYELDWAPDFEAGIAAIKKNGYDVYLVDYRIGKDDGLELLKSVRDSNHLKCPFIMLTGIEDRELDMEAMRSGAADFLIKSHLTPDLLDRAIRYAIQQSIIVRKLKDKKERLDTAQKIAKIGSWEWDISTDRVIWSDQTFYNLGYKPKEVQPSLETFLSRVVPEDRPLVKRHLKSTIEQNQPYRFEYRIQCQDGLIRYMFEDGRMVFDENGRPWKIVGTMQDITERKNKERELQFKNTVIDTAVLPVAFSDMEGKITQVNKAFLSTWGYDSVDEVKGMSVSAFSNCSKKAEEIMKVLEETGTFRGEDVAKKRDGGEFDVFLSANVVKDAQGSPIGMQSTFLDITELKQVRRDLEQKNKLIRQMNRELEGLVKARTAELAESQQRLREAQRMARVGHWEADMERGVYRWSETLYELVGMDKAVKINSEIEPSIIHPDDRIKVETYLQRARETGEGEPIDFRAFNPRGTEMWLQAQVKKSQTDTSGRILKLFGIVKEITESKLAAKALEAALDKERYLNQTKSQFVSMASHEFRTPLTTIMASIDLIEAYLENGQLEKQRKHIKRIGSAVDNLTTILNDFLSLEKLESDSVTLNPETVKWSSFAKELVNEVSGLCQAGQKVRVEYNGPQQVFLDKHLVKNILLNLLSNALKYSPGGEPIDLCSEVKDKMLIVEVIDRGIGIPEEEQKRMFTRFFRASNVENIKGTGLGLTIVKRYLDLMKGSISFTSQPGRGTTFRIEIPQKTIEKNPDQEIAKEKA